MTDFNINVVVDPVPAAQGLGLVNNSLNKTAQNADRLRNQIGNVVKLIAAGFGVRQVIALADAFTLVQNRLKLVTTGTSNLRAVTEQLFQISNSTRGSFEATAEVYTRTAQATKDLGLTQQETLNFTKSLNQAVALSGASAAEAAGSMLQLSQGLATGALQGDELRSVLEGLPAVADIISQSLNVTRGELKALGPQGKITADVIINAFKQASDSLDASFAKTIPTVGQAFVVLRNTAIRELSVLNEATGFTESLSRAILFLADNLNVLTRIIGAVAIVLGVNFAKDAVGSAIAGVRILTAVIAANPIGALLVGLTAAVALLTTFSDQITIGSDGLVTLQDYAVATFEVISSALAPVITAISDGIGGGIEFAINAVASLGISFEDVLLILRNVVNSFIGLFVGFANAVGSIFSDIRKIISKALGADTVTIVSKSFSALLDSILGIVNKIGDVITTLLQNVGILAKEVSTVLGNTDFEIPDSGIISTVAGIGVNAKKAFVEGFNQDFVGGILGAVEPGFQAIENRARELSQQREVDNAKREQERLAGEAQLNVRPEATQRGPRADVQKILDDLQKEASLLQLVGKEREIYGAIIKYEESLNRSLSDSEKELIENQLKLVDSLRTQSEVLDSINGPQEELAIRLDATNQLYAQGLISLQQYSLEMQNLALAQAELNIQMGEGTFADGFILSMQSMIESAQNFRAEAGASFGDFFTQLTDGFADAAANAIVFGDNIGESLGNVARQALAGLISGLIKLGIQFALNAALGQTAAAAATAAGVAQAAALSTAYATPAALASLASYGANAAPAAAGITATVALSQGLALAGAVGLKDGGFVSGPGGPRSDSVPAMLSNGEFVVNASATSKHRPMLESINSGRGFADGGIVSKAPSSPQASSTNNGTELGSRINVVNVLDPKLVGDYLDTGEGEQTLINVIQRNASAVNAVLRG